MTPAGITRVTRRDADEKPAGNKPFSAGEDSDEQAPTRAGYDYHDFQWPRYNDDLGRSFLRNIASAPFAMNGSVPAGATDLSNLKI